LNLRGARQASWNVGGAFSTTRSQCIILGWLVGDHPLFFLQVAQQQGGGCCYKKNNESMEPLNGANICGRRKRVMVLVQSNLGVEGHSPGKKALGEERQVGFRGGVCLHTVDQGEDNRGKLLWYGTEFDFRRSSRKERAKWVEGTVCLGVGSRVGVCLWSEHHSFGHSGKTWFVFIGPQELGGGVIKPIQPELGSSQ